MDPNAELRKQRLKSNLKLSAQSEYRKSKYLQSRDPKHQKSQET